MWLTRAAERGRKKRVNEIVMFARSVRPSKRAGLGILLLLMLLAGLPALLSKALNNAGMLLLSRGLMSNEERLRASLGAGIYPPYAGLRGADLDFALGLLQHATEPGADNVRERWSLGRAALAAGDATKAEEVLQPLSDRVGDNPLLYLDTLTAFVQANDPARAVALYESAPLPIHTQAISDTIALAYLDAALPGSLEKARTLRPLDLYINYQLWKQAHDSGDVAAAAPFSQTLAYFSLDAIYPANQRLRDDAAQVIPELLANRIWDRAGTLNVVAYLVWQHPDSTTVETMVRDLSARYPTEPEWVFYLAEVYHRRGDWEQAEAAYRRVVQMAPNFAEAYLRLGMVAEARCPAIPAQCTSDRQETAQWYTQYHQRAPDDPVGWQRLVETYQATGKPTDALQQEWERKWDEQRFVADSLAVPLESVQLGPNLVENGDFQSWVDDKLVDWRLEEYLGYNHDSGLYAAGEDTLLPGGAARIVNLWGGPLPDGTITYAEFVGIGLHVPEGKYSVKVTFRTPSPSEGTGFFFLGDYTGKGGLVLDSRALPSSAGRWQSIFFLVYGSSNATPVVPLIRNWGTGGLWIQAIEIRPVTIKANLR